MSRSVSRSLERPVVDLLAGVVAGVPARRRRCQRAERQVDSRRVERTPSTRRPARRPTRRSRRSSSIACAERLGVGEADVPQRDVRRHRLELDPQPGRVAEGAVGVGERVEQVGVLAVGRCAVTISPAPVRTSISSTDSCGRPLRNDVDSMPSPVTAPPSVIVRSWGTTSGISPCGSVASTRSSYVHMPWTSAVRRRRGSTLDDDAVSPETSRPGACSRRGRNRLDVASPAGPVARRDGSYDAPSCSTAVHVRRPGEGLPHVQTTARQCITPGPLRFPRQASQENPATTASWGSVAQVVLVRLYRSLGSPGRVPAPASHALAPPRDPSLSPAAARHPFAARIHVTRRWSWRSHRRVAHVDGARLRPAKSRTLPVHRRGRLSVSTMTARPLLTPWPPPWRRDADRGTWSEGRSTVAAA